MSAVTLAAVTLVTQELSPPANWTQTMCLTNPPCWMYPVSSVEIFSFSFGMLYFLLNQIPALFWLFELDILLEYRPIK